MSRPNEFDEKMSQSFAVAFIVAILLIVPGIFWEIMISDVNIAIKTGTGIIVFTTVVAIARGFYNDYKDRK